MRRPLGDKVESNLKAYTRKLKHPEETEYIKQWSSGFLNGWKESLYQSTCRVKNKASGLQVLLRALPTRVYV